MDIEYSQMLIVPIQQAIYYISHVASEFISIHSRSSTIPLRQIIHFTFHIVSQCVVIVIHHIFYGLRRRLNLIFFARITYAGQGISATTPNGSVPLEVIYRSSSSKIKPSSYFIIMASLRMPVD